MIDSKKSKERRAFIQHLVIHLPKSSHANRNNWADTIISEQIPVDQLLPLLSINYKIASRMLWLFSQIALKDASCLRPFLWNIYKAAEDQKIKGREASIANQWLLCGLPQEHEAEAIDVLFAWLSSTATNSTTKSRAKKALVPYIEKYPDLKNELELSTSTE